MSLPLLKSLPAAPPAKILQKGQAVGDSDDLRRILALPRREKPSDEQIAEWARDFKEELGVVNPACECRTKYRRPCCDQLKPVQAWALYEAATVGGILGPIGVGHGKTLLDLLVPMVAFHMFGAKTCLLLLPPNLKRQFLDVDWGYYGQHWQLPNLAGGRWMVPGRPLLHVVAFSELSGSRSSDLLDRLRPDCIVVDEAHSVRNRTAARTKRFLRHFDKNPNVRLFCWSGTLTSRSIRDYAHLSAHALGRGSPVPRAWHTLEEWAAALDPGDYPAPPGLLSRLSEGRPDESVRDGFQRRLVGSAGVVSSGDAASCQASLVISERKVEAPAEVTKHLAALEATWQRPDGEELVDVLSKARCARELSCGFYLRWRWPRGEPVAVIERWLLARKNWHKELREKLKKSTTHMDSPLLCTRAAIRWEEGYTHVERDRDGNELRRFRVDPHTRGGPLPTWETEFWPTWREVRDTAKPETEAVWLSDFLVEDCLDWAADHAGLIWYEFKDLAAQIERRAEERGIERFVRVGVGDAGDRQIIGLTGQEAALVSLRSHREGKNLQMFGEMLVLNPPSDGGQWEQTLGRIHRQGQERDELFVYVYRHTAPFLEAVERARDLSQYIEGTWGAAQRLASVATWGF